MKSIDLQQRICSLLLDRMPGSAYRCLPDQARTMEFISEGCLHLTGYEPSELIQNRKISYGQLILPEDRDFMWGGIQKAMQGDRFYDISYRIRTLAGQEKWIREFGCVVVSTEGNLVALEGILLDISDYKFSEIYIQKQAERFEAIRKIDMAITGSYDLRVTLDILLDQVITYLRVDAADILLFDPSTQILNYIAGRGFRGTSIQHTRVRLGEGEAGIAALEHHAVRVDNLQESLGELKRCSEFTSEGFHSYYGIPLIAKGQVKGILELFHRRNFTPSVEWIEFLEALAAQAAIAIENATLYNELQKSNLELNLAHDAALEGLSKALELRDDGRRGHTQRVSELSIRLAQMLKLEMRDLINIRRGVLLHGIGEISIPEKILLKPGPLTEEEWAIVRQHPVYAYKLLSSIPSLLPALDIPYCHHENWDGTGYPRGLREEQIPLTARIFAVADVWVVLLSDRPYRKAWKKSDAIHYFRAQCGKQFDPHVVDIFLSMMTGRN